MINASEYRLHIKMYVNSGIEEKTQLLKQDFTI